MAKLTEEEKLQRKQEEHEQDALAKERERIYKDMVAYEHEHAKEEKIAPEGSFISLQHINKIYGNRVQAVYDFNLEVKEHEFIVFVGPSGCGKSTTLRMIAGLEAITAGDLYIDGVYSNDLEPKDRNLSMVFQNYALYPHMSVYNNMAFGLKMKKLPREEIDERVHRVAKILQLEEYLDRKPKALSGGQCQRVALGRAIVRDTKLFLMDEPLSNLDAKLRVQMRSEIVNLHDTLGATTIYVTHDQTEAMTMATRIVVMSKGYIQQVGTPREVYNSPANIFVATFIGSPAMNIINGKYSNGTLTLKNGAQFSIDKAAQEKVKAFYEKQIEELLAKKDEYSIDLNSPDASIVSLAQKRIDNALSQIDTYKANLAGEHDILIGIRPENIVKVGLSTNATKLSPEMNVEVTASELLGQEYYIHYFVGDQKMIAKIDAIKDINTHDHIDVQFDLDMVRLFDTSSEKLIL